MDDPVPLTLVRMQDGVLAVALGLGYLFDGTGVVLLAFLTMVTGVLVGTKGHPFFLFGRAIWELVDGENGEIDQATGDPVHPVPMKDGRQVRFDQGVASALLGASTACFVTGRPVAGWILALIQAGVSAVSLFGFCAVCALTAPWRRQRHSGHS